ncbi:M15 family metallopeptidase [Candidatus Bathyarchaeota archaeon]|nr:M15 family metallopeptidase [Candidatus Bathyarchaeota archaeon]
MEARLMDAVSEQRLQKVHPLLAEKIRAMASQLMAEGIPIRVTQGLRTWEEQEDLYRQGRNGDTRPIVTNAPPGFSFHQFGLAVDCVPMTDKGPDWNITHPVWQRMIAVGQSLGLTSGATWRSFPDAPHFQYTGILSATPTNQVRQAYQTGGIQAVWTMAGMPHPYTSSEINA